MATLLDDLYPTFRLFLYDGRMRYSIPYTIFGPYRAAKIRSEFRQKDLSTLAAKYFSGSMGGRVMAA